MAERDLTIDDFDCAKHVLFFKKCAKSLPAPWTWTVAVLAVGDVSVSLAFFSVVVFMGARIMSLDILMGIISTWTSSPCSDAFPQFFPQEQYKTMDTNRLTLLYFSISGLDLLGHLDEIDREATIRYIYSFQSPFDEHGGFYGYPKAWKQRTKKTETTRLFLFVLWLLGFWAI